MNDERGWATCIGLLALLPPLAVGLVWVIDPPWQVGEIQGVVLGSGNKIAPGVRVQYYKVYLLVKAEDGHSIGVFSERHVPPAAGTRITVQERVGLFGTRTFIEIPVR
jgi:hypothetical protein